MPADREVAFNWLDQGPDNVGGRTRAILVDKDDINHVYAGSVSGGLFESFNRANEWNRVDEFKDNLGVSSMCQTIDGTIYVATGHEQESTGGSQNAYDSGHNGYGMYKKETSGLYTLVANTEDYNYINEIVCDTLNNVVWMATNDGLIKYNPAGTGSLTEVDGGITSGACHSLSISPDGQVIVANMGSGRTNISTDYGSTFTDRSGSGAGEIEPVLGRIEYAISHEKIQVEHIMYMLLVPTTICLESGVQQTTV
ncbi:MAG: hypothetical protein IPM77_17350 [Crocinitomicaceae bacterium]|nr:hypothetical protein [Crocinitomicaceae bacterium]